MHNPGGGVPLLGGRHAHPLTVIETADTMGEPGAWQQLHPRTVTLWRLQLLVRGLVFLVVVAAGGAILHQSTESIDPVIAVGVIGFVLLIIVAGAAFWPSVAYRHWRYRLAPDALELERGVVTRRRSIVPYGRVQQVDLTRGPIDRSLGLTGARLLTASSSTDGAVPGLSPEDAEAFRRLVLQRAGRDDAV